MKQREDEFDRSIKRLKIFREVVLEIRRAELVFPDWPSNLIEAAAIVVEEAGESMKEALNMRDNDPHRFKTTLEDYRKELIQTAAMAFRALEHLPMPGRRKKKK